MRNGEVSGNRVFSIGVDMGGTNLRIGAYDSEYTALESVELATRLEMGPRGVIADICGAINQLILRHGKERRCAGIGVGTPGPLLLPSGRMRNPPNLPGWDNFNIRREIEIGVGREIFLECDANTAALGEFVLGAGASTDCESMCMLTLGTGVGNGLVVNGSIWHGTHGMGGEAGHLTVYPEGRECGCGNLGCLEQYASATAVKRTAREIAESNPGSDLLHLVKQNPDYSAREVAELADAGDQGAKLVFERIGVALGIAVASLVNILDMKLYVIGGGLIGAWGLFSPSMFAEMNRRSYVYRLANECENGGGITVQPAKLGSLSGILGAAALAFLSSEDGSEPDRAAQLSQVYKEGALEPSRASGGFTEA